MLDKLKDMKTSWVQNSFDIYKQYRDLKSIQHSWYLIHSVVLSWHTHGNVPYAEAKSSKSVRTNPNLDLHWDVTYKKGTLSWTWYYSNPFWQWSFRKHWRETKVFWQVSLCTSLWQNEFHAPFWMLFIAHLLKAHKSKTFFVHPRPMSEKMKWSLLSNKTD